MVYVLVNMCEYSTWALGHYGVLLFWQQDITYNEYQTQRHIIISFWLSSHKMLFDRCAPRERNCLRCTSANAMWMRHKYNVFILWEYALMCPCQKVSGSCFAILQFHPQLLCAVCVWGIRKDKNHSQNVCRQWEIISKITFGPSDGLSYISLARCEARTVAQWPASSDTVDASQKFLRHSVYESHGRLRRHLFSFRRLRCCVCAAASVWLLW